MGGCDTHAPSTSIFDASACDLVRWYPERMLTRHRLIFGARLVVLALVGCTVVCGCASTGIAVREQFGFAKREQLVDRIEDAQDSQTKAKEQFASTLDEFKSLTGFDGGDLERTYSVLKRELARSEDRAKAVTKRINSIERVGDALFDEWKKELSAYSSESLRRASAAELDNTRARYERVVGAMRAAESKMGPVLSAFQDQVLFLKHNLNARAIASLESTVLELDREIGELIASMNDSIAQAQAFVDQMTSSS